MFVEEWNLCSSVLVKRCDTTSMNCDIKNSGVLSILDSHHGSFLSENATGDKHKRLKISWKSLRKLVATKSLTKKI